MARCEGFLMKRLPAALLALFLSGCGTPQAPTPNPSHPQKPGVEARNEPEVRGDQAVRGEPATRSEAAADPVPVPPALARHQELAREGISGERARELVSFMDSLYRVPGNRGFDASLGKVIEALEEAGYEDEEEHPSGPLTYRIESREMSRPTWEPVAARSS